MILAKLINKPEHSPEVYPHRYSHLMFDKGAKSTQWRTAFSTSGAGTVRHICAKKFNLDRLHLWQILTQNGPDLNVLIKHKTIKLLENNMGENLDDLGYGAKFLQSWLTLCDLMDCQEPADSSVHGILQAIRNGLPFPPPGDLPNPGIEPVFLTSPALAHRFFTTSTT